MTTSGCDMARAALLPTPGDPFLLTLWSYFFKNVWGKEIDKLYICVNNIFLPESTEYIKSLFKDCSNVEIEFIDSISYPNVVGDHGKIIAHMLNQVEEDYILLIEDDGFIFKPGYVNNYFLKLENYEYDLIGSRRGSCSDVIIEQSKIKYNIAEQNGHDNGPNFWPCFFFIRKNIFELTDKNFSAKLWGKNSILPIFGKTLDTDCAGDTMVWMSMQLRNLNLKIGDCPQFHGNLSDVLDYELKLNNFDGTSYWLHAGSLSSGIGGFLSDKELPDYCNTDEEKNEIERRICFWSLGLDSYFKEQSSQNKINKIALQYQSWLQRLVKHYQLSDSRIDYSKKMYAELLRWI